MWITHSYLGTTRGSTRCLFFLLFEDYIEAQRGLHGDVKDELERFARNLGDSGAVVLPFPADASDTHQQVLQKGWTEDEQRELRKTPAVLMIDTDFAQFDPRTHSWILYHFDRAPDHTYAAKLRSLLDKLSEAAGSEDDPFSLVGDAVRRDSLAGSAKVFKLEPGAFGISVDLRAGWDVLKHYLRGRIGRQAEATPTRAADQAERKSS